MASIASSIERQVFGFPQGEIFSMRDLAINKASSVATAKKLNRMTHEGKIRKVSKGKYYRPRKSIFGELKPSQSEIINKWVNSEGKNIAYITGIALYNQLGLSTQVPSTISIACNSRRSPIEIGNVKLKFVLQKNKVSKSNIRGLKILDVSKGFNSIPDKDNSTIIRWFKDELKSLDIKLLHNLIKLSMNYSPRTRALIGALIEELGYNHEAEIIKKSLNPLSRYKLNISNKLLSNKEDWNIE